MEKYKFFVGCDMSKSFFDVSFLSFANDVQYLGQFSNDHKGFEEMESQLLSRTSIPAQQWLVCFENTGIYSKAFLEWLVSKQIPCKEENPIQIARSLGIRRGKNDQADSRDICQYGFEKRDSILPSQLSQPLIVELRKLLSRRDTLVRHKQALEQSVNEQKASLNPKLKKLFVKQNDALLKVMNEQIAELDQEIEKTIESDDDLNNNSNLIKGVIGIGPVISAYMIAATENFSCFTDGRKFASYSGIAPFQNSSGTKLGRTRVSHFANKKIKTLLFNAAVVAAQHDKELKLYFQRKRLEGKPEGVIYNNIKNKIIHRVFAVVKRQSPFVRLANYK